LLSASIARKTTRRRALKRVCASMSRNAIASTICRQIYVAAHNAGGGGARQSVKDQCVGEAQDQPRPHLLATRDHHRRKRMDAFAGCLAPPL
jgi:hypothetical protein